LRQYAITSCQTHQRGVEPAHWRMLARRLDSSVQMSDKTRMNFGRLSIARAPGIMARLTFARRPI
jgi:hypothetical protein